MPVKTFIEPLIGGPKPPPVQTDAQPAQPAPADTTLPSTPPAPVEEPQVETPEQTQQQDQNAGLNTEVSDETHDFFIVLKNEAEFGSIWKDPSTHLGKGKPVEAYKLYKDAKNDIDTQKLQDALIVKIPGVSISYIGGYEKPKPQGTPVITSAGQSGKDWVSIKNESNDKKLEAYNNHIMFQLYLYDIKSQIKPIIAVSDDTPIQTQAPAMTEARALSVEEFSKLFT